MKIWIGVSNPPEGSGFIKDSAVHGLSVSGDADFISVEYDVGEPGITGLDVLQTLYRGFKGMAKSQTVGTHEPDSDKRELMVELLRSISHMFHHNKYVVSDDGGVSYHDV